MRTTFFNRSNILSTGVSKEGSIQCHLYYGSGGGDGGRESEFVCTCMSEGQGTYPLSHLLVTRSTLIQESIPICGLKKLCYYWIKPRRQSIRLWLLLLIGDWGSFIRCFSEGVKCLTKTSKQTNKQTKLTVFFLPQVKPEQASPVEFDMRGW